jgi:hypothetical protein
MQCSDIQFALDNDTEMRQWYDGCHKQITQIYNSDSIRKFFQICQQSRNANPTIRPSFDSLYDRLSEQL